MARGEIFPQWAKQGVLECLSADLPLASLEALTVGALEPGAALCLAST